MSHRPRFSPTFRLRAILIAFVPCAVVSTLAAAIFAYVQNDDIQERYLLTYKAEVQSLADQSADLLLKGNRTILVSLCKDVAEHRDIGLASILDESGKITATARSKVDFEETQRFQAGIRHFKVDDKGIIDSDLIGLAVIEASKKSIFIQQRRLVTECIAFVMAGYAFGLGLALFISQNLTIPFRRISDTVSRIAAGEFGSRVSITGDESVRGLAEGINSMAESIENAQNHLLSQVEAATEAMRMERDQAREVTLAKSRFVVAATHDLRQPMQALRLLSVELESRLKGDDEIQIVSQMLDSLSVVDQLIESFLDMSRLDAGVVKQNTSTFSPALIFDRLKPEFYRIASSKGIEIRFKSSKHNVTTDPMLLERILRNLISNAIRYTKSSVVVGVRYTPASIIFEVRDNGPGINDDDMQRIFGDFVQLNNPERHQNKGLGMGLSIVKRLSKLLDIKVAARSKVGNGSVFSILIPNLSLPPTAVNVAKNDSPDIDVRRKVALISDLPTEFEVCHETLASLGCEQSHFSLLNQDEIVRLLDYRPDFLLAHEDHWTKNSRSGLWIDSVLKVYPNLCIILSGDNPDLDNIANVDRDLLYIGNSVRASKVRSIIQRRSVTLN